MFYNSFYTVTVTDILKLTQGGNYQIFILFCIKFYKIIYFFIACTCLNQQFEDMPFLVKFVFKFHHTIDIFSMYNNVDVFK